jgi:predicted ArsR family transcriptional regulator
MEQESMIDRFRARFERYRTLSAELGESHAFETMLDGYPERQRQKMGPYIANATLAEGFSRAIPRFREIGMNMEVLDVSNGAVDAAIEVQRICPFLDMCRDYGLAKPCRVICQMDIEATQRAFPELKVDLLCAQADGACVCVFKYERTRQEPPDGLSTAPGRA